MLLEFLGCLRHSGVGCVRVAGFEKRHRFRAEIDNIIGGAVGREWEPGQAFGGALYALLRSPNSFQCCWHHTHLVYLIDAPAPGFRKYLTLAAEALR